MRGGRGGLGFPRVPGAGKGAAQRGTGSLLLLSVLWTGALAVGASGAAASPEEETRFEAYERSLELVRKEMARHPAGDARLALVLARVHYRSGRFREAIREFERAVKSHPDSAALYLGLGNAYLQIGETDEAIEAFRRGFALPLSEESMKAGMSLADAYYTSRRYSEAVAQLRSLAGKGVRNAEVCYRLGRALEAAARRATAPESKAEGERMEGQAVAILERAIALDPQHAKAHYVLAGILLRQGNKDKGRHHLDRFRRLKREEGGVDEEKLAQSDAGFEASTAVELARALFDLGEVENALKYLELALEVHEGSERALALRGWIYMRSGRGRDAARAYSELLARNPEHGEALWNLGRLLVSSGQAERGGDLLLRAAKAPESPPRAWETLYQLAAQKKVHPGRAEEFARKALESRGSARNYVNLAMALFEAGELEECEKVLRRGLVHFPDDQELRIGLQSVLAARGGKR